MSTRRALTIRDTDGDELVITETDPDTAHPLEVFTDGGHTVYVTRGDLDALRSFLLTVATRA